MNTSPNEPPVERATVRARLDYAEQQAIAFRAVALTELDRANYSGAATACHRAHQHARVAEALRGLLA